MIARLLRQSPLALLTIAFVVSLPAVTPRFYASDEIEYFAYLRSLWFDHDLSFDNEYRYFYDHGVAHGGPALANGEGYLGGNFEATFLEARTPTGLRINFAPMGTAILWSPFYALADVGVRVARALGSQVPADGYSFPYIAAVTYGSAVYGFLALVLSAVVVRRVLGYADWTLAAVWLGTPLLFYMYVAPGFSHACSAFAVAAFVVVWLRTRDRWSSGGVVALAALAALMALVREQDVFIAIGPTIDYVVRLCRTRDTPLLISVGRAIAGLVTFAVCFAPQAIAYWVLYRRLGPSPLVAEKMNWTAPHAWELLVSTEHGFFWWTPLAVLALFGLVLLVAGQVRTAGSLPRNDALWVGVLCLVMVASQIYVSGSVSSWPGSAFGQRRLISVTVFLSLGLAALFRAAQPRTVRYTLGLLVTLSVWWNLGLIAQYGTGLMDRQQLNLARNTYHNFVTIPSLVPRLAYRYLFDRPSFYRSAPLPSALSTKQDR